MAVPEPDREVVVQADPLGSKTAGAEAAGAEAVVRGDQGRAGLAPAEPGTSGSPGLMTLAGGRGEDRLGLQGNRTSVLPAL